MRWACAIVVGVASAAVAAGPGRSYVPSDSQSQRGPVEALPVERVSSERAEAVRAANDAAVRGLLDQVGVLPVGGRFSVAEFVRQAGAERELAGFLQGAHQVGAPRWLDERTVQVQLTIEAREVITFLMELADRMGRRSPLTPLQIENGTVAWSRSTFAATGASALQGDLTLVRPAGGSSWAQVDERTRRDALARARRDAVEEARVRIDQVPLLPDRPIAKALDGADSRHRLDEWLAARPLRKIEFRDDLYVEVGLAVESAELCEQIRAIASDAGLRLDEEQWRRVQGEIERRVGEPVGRAQVARPSAPALPAEAPEWAGRRIEVEGVYVGPEPKLRCAVLADADARQKLMRIVEGLPISQGRTLGAISSTDPRIRAALLEQVQSARVYRTEYPAEGGARVRLLLDLRRVWDAVRPPGISAPLER